MLINSWRLCRAKEPVERIGYAVLWAVMVLLMNAHDITQAIASLMVALLALAVCSDLGRSVPRFWPRHFCDVLCRASGGAGDSGDDVKNRTEVRGAGTVSVSVTKGTSSL
jgi:hypothetical protein